MNAPVDVGVAGASARTPGGPGSADEPASVARIPARAAQALLRLQPPADAGHLRRAELARSGRFEAVGEVHAIGAPPRWLHNPSRDPEWLIAVHKLPMLVDLAHAWRLRRDARDVAAWCRIVDEWLTGMGTGELACSDAQVEAKRIEHCIVSLLLLQETGALELVPADLVRGLLHRIAEEAGYLLAHLKPSRNHRTFQLYAAFLAGSLVGPCLPGAAALVAAAQEGVARELLVQNLLADFGPDGVHCELSTHYHQITLEAALGFVAIARGLAIQLPAALHERLRAALAFSAWITLPDGEIPLINDSDNGFHQPLLALGAELYDSRTLAFVASAGNCGVPPQALSHHFHDAGYLVMRDTWSAGAGDAGPQHLFYDCARLGAGSHAHYDLFSFCYTVAGRQVVVDPGRYTYDPEPGADGIDWRHRFKRTAAHNTVCIDGRDQTRYLSKARKPAAGLHRLDRERVAPGGSKHGPAVEVGNATVTLGARSALVCASAISREYTPVHTRCLAYVLRQYVLVIDRVHAEDGQRHQASFHLQFAAEWQDRIALTRSDRGVELAAHAAGDDERVAWRLLLDAPGAEVELGRGLVSKAYGHKQPAPCLDARRELRDEAFWTCVVAPEGSACTVTGLQVRHGEGCSIATVTGTSFGRPFVDRLLVHWNEGGLVIRPDYHLRASMVLERRVGGALDHLLAAGVDDWFTQLTPAQGRLAPDAEGKLEW
jgi:hypothetical protein